MDPITTVAPSPTESPADQEPQRLPPYAVVVLNDDVHTFDYVVATFRQVLGYTTERCWQLAVEIHSAGRGVVWTGPKEVAELKRDQLRAVAPEVIAGRPIGFPLGCQIEPLPTA